MLHRELDLAEIDEALNPIFNELTVECQIQILKLILERSHRLRDEADTILISLHNMLATTVEEVSLFTVVLWVICIPWPTFLWISC